MKILNEIACNLNCIQLNSNESCSNSIATKWVQIDGEGIEIFL
jgi:hypothetical protein